MTICPQCGEANPDRFRLCGMCGAPLAATAEPIEVRKTVTVLFCDLKGSTTLGEQLDTESLREALSLYFDAMQAVIRRHGGTVEKYIGDAIMAVFGLPAVHEDDALRAVRAALEMQTRLGSVNAELHRRWGVRLENRIGVNTGEVVAGDPHAGQRLVTGDTVNTAARLEQAAPPGEILIGGITRDLVRHAVDLEPVEPLELKGKAERVAAFRLLGLRSEAMTDRRMEAPLVGRDAEMEALMARAAAAAANRTPGLVTIVGSPGVGKSRLIEAFLAASGSGSRALRGRCLPYGDGITFWPIIEMVRAAAAIEDDVPAEAARLRLVTLAGGRPDVAERLAPLLGLDEGQHPIEETFWAVRVLFETLAGDDLLVVVIDDLHRAEPTLLDLVEHVLDTASAPVLVVCSARADLLDSRPTWAERPDALRLDLGPLSGTETSTVIANILGEGIPPEVVDRIIRSAEGNPLFVEQTLSMLVDQGALRRSDDGRWEWTAAADVPVPPTLTALMEARVDSLGPDARSVVQIGSVIGQVFYRGAVLSIADGPLKPRVDDSLGHLRRRQFIRPDPSTFMDESADRFDHALVHDAVYRSLLKRARADLHGRVASWLEAVGESRIRELEEIVGFHLEQSALLLAQLGPLDAHGRAVAQRGSARLASAGRRAAARGDSPAATSLFQRAADLLDPDARERVDLLLDLGEGYAALGEFDRSDGVVQDALDSAARLGDDLLACNARLVRLFLRYTLDPEGMSDQVVRETTEAIPMLTAAGDHAGLVRAWRLLGWVHGTACRYGDAATAVERAVVHARKAGDRRAETRNLMSLALAALYGPMPTDEAVRLADRITSAVEGDRLAESVGLCAGAHLRALRGDVAEARDLYRRARDQLEELGGPMMAATVSLDSARVELMAGDLDAAERELRLDFSVLEAAGERYTRSTIAGLLADTLERQGRIDEARAMVEITRATAAEDDVESQCLWRRVSSRLAVGEDIDAARTLGEEALRLARQTDAPVLTGEILRDLARSDLASGRRDEAHGRLVEALDLFRTKGASVLADEVAVLMAAGDRIAAPRD